MYLTPNIFGVEQHQEQMKNNTVGPLSLDDWCGVNKMNFPHWIGGKFQTVVSAG